ncbi:hypothetical protein C8R45DRAFT_1014752 [Mycena sanguinolenta]|nr:hypothetical protein C8R45DRAFT_1014752 [Mycena sanguinolenta]
MSSKSPAVHLASLVVDSLFYGIYLVLFLTSTYILVYAANVKSPRKSRSALRSMVFVSAVGLFCVVTGTALDHARFPRLLELRDLRRRRPFEQGAPASETAKNILLALSILVGDAMILCHPNPEFHRILVDIRFTQIYRLWIVWCRSKYIVVVPILSLLALAGTSILAVKAGPSSSKMPSPHLVLALDSVFTLTTNIYCTGFISWKIWRITRITMPTDGMDLRKFPAILVESAGIYARVEGVLTLGEDSYADSAWVVFYTVTLYTESSMQDFVLLTTPTVVGIANALIHTRVGLGWATEEGRRMEETWPRATTIRFPSPAAGSDGGDI